MGLKILKRKQRGCHLIDKYFGFIKTQRQEPIFTFDASNLPIYIINFKKNLSLNQLILI